MSVSDELVALAVTAIVHVAGIVALVGALVAGEDQRRDWRGWFGGPDDDGPPPSPPDPRGSGLPLESAESSLVRLREPARLADAHRAPSRRPRHDPRRAPGRAPARD